MVTPRAIVLDQALMSPRAVEAVIWGMPAVNFQRMYEAFAETLGGDFNQLVYWSRLADWRNQTLLITSIMSRQCRNLRYPAVPQRVERRCVCR